MLQDSLWLGIRPLGVFEACCPLPDVKPLGITPVDGVHLFGCEAARLIGLPGLRFRVLAE